MAGLAAKAQSQSPYFIYMQAEPAQSFTVVYKEQAFRSSASGYVIVPNLTDSILQLAVRFSEQKYPDCSFGINTQRSDQGYLLKDYGEKGWGLLDWRTLAVSYAQRPAVIKGNAIAVDGQTDFATMLAKASGDSTLLLDSSTPDRITTSKPAAAVSQSVAPVAALNENVARKPDTTITNKPLAEVKTTKEVKSVAMETSSVMESKSAVISIPSYCKSILTEAEFSECLSKVQVARSETSKVNVLREFISGRCYTIDQVKALALLLTTDDVRYDFLLEAWTHTAERSRYLVLASVFSSPATVDRFKEMFQ